MTTSCLVRPLDKTYLELDMAGKILQISYILVKYAREMNMYVGLSTFKHNLS